jgi:hypothetical protein
MGFGWLGTFRQGQWQAYRSFVLNERRDVGQRIAVIQAELKRIGNVDVRYAEVTTDTGETQISEQRVSMAVTQGSTLEKLFQAYIAQGGNPFDVSLFLTPDSTYVNAAGNLTETQPYGGVIYPKNGSYDIGTSYEGGWLVVKKYPPARTGGRKDLKDNLVAGAVDTSRRWVNTTIQNRIHDLEARIIKQCDLREQLLSEIESLTMAMGGITGDLPTLNQDFYDEKLGVAKIVAAIDSIFYLNDDNGVPDFNTINEPMLEDYRSLLLDLEGEEDNTAL